jgi:16S rRNA (uracil1498-N3)-methyltransferase
MHRFFVAQTPLHVDDTVDLASLTHQLHTVLRLRQGAKIELLDGSGAVYTVRISALSSRAGHGVVLAQSEPPGEPSLHLTLYQCSLKADRFEWVLQKGTELGVSRFVPVISRRSVVRPATTLLKKYDRWNQIVREAAEQCGRTRLPYIGAPLGLRELPQDDTELYLLPWEATAARGAAGIGEALVAAGSVSRVSLLIGPEGGFDKDEIEVALAANWQVVSLGPRILRAETAALVASTLIMGHYGELGGGWVDPGT